MRKSFSDVTVIGGGPAGSFAALSIARAGVEVRCFEEHIEIGVPCHCAGHLSIASLRLLGLYPLPPRVIESTYRGAVFHSPNGQSLRVRHPTPVTCSVQRTLFEKHLASMAMKAGVSYVMNSRVRSLAIRNGSVEGVVVRSGKRDEEAESRIVIDAEGVSQRILAQAGLPLTGRDRIVRTISTEVENVESVEKDMVEVFLSQKYAPGFYAWLMPKPDGKAKLGLATRRGNPKQLLRRLIAKHPGAADKLRNARIIRASFHRITLGGPIPQAFSNRFVAVGDAASQVKPTTGGGLLFGMTCASIAAAVVVRALRSNNPSAVFLGKYQKKCEEILGRDVRLMLKLRAVLDVLPDRRIDQAFDLFKKVNLEKSLQDFDVDFHGHSILRNLWNPRIHVVLLHSLFLYLLADRRAAEMVCPRDMHEKI